MKALSLILRLFAVAAAVGALGLYLYTGDKLEAARTELTDAKDELSRTIADRERLRQQAEGKRRLVSSISENLKSAGSTIENYVAQEKSAAEEVVTLTQKVQELTAEIEDKNTQIQELRAEIFRRGSQEGAVSETLYADLKATNDNLSAKAKELEDNARRLQNQISQLRR